MRFACVHRDVRAAQELVARRPVLGRDCDPDAALHLERHAGDLAGKCDRAAEPLGNRKRGDLVGRALAQDAELVAAEPGDDLALADDVVEPGRDDRQQLVPPVVAERVVDLLEALEIDEEHG